MLHLLIVLLLAVLSHGADSDYIPHGARAPLQKGDTLTILPCVAFDTAGFDGNSRHFSRSQGVTIDGFDGRFYRVRLADGSRVYIYRTELGVRPSAAEAAARAARSLPPRAPEQDRVPQAGDTLSLFSPMWYKDSDLLAESHLLSGTRSMVVLKAENELGFLQVDGDSLGRGWIYRVELDPEERRPAASVKDSR